MPKRTVHLDELCQSVGLTPEKLVADYLQTVPDAKLVRIGSYSHTPDICGCYAEIDFPAP